MYKKISRKMIVMAVLFIGCLGLFCFNDAHAGVMGESSLYKLSILRGVRKCYEEFARDEINSGEFDGSLGATVDSYNQMIPLFEGPGHTNKYWRSSDIVKIPTKIDNSESDSELYCKEVFNGGKNAKGFNNYYKFPEKLEDLGYEIKTQQTGGDGGYEVDVKLLSVKGLPGPKEDDTYWRSNVKTTVSEGKDRITCRFLVSNNEMTLQSCKGEIEAKIAGDSDPFINFAMDGDADTIQMSALYGSEIIRDDLVNAFNNSSEESFSVGSGGDVGAAFEKAVFVQTLYDFLQEVASRAYGAQSREYRGNDGLHAEIKTECVENRRGDLKDIYCPISGSRLKAADVMLEKIGIDKSLPTMSKSGINYYYWSTPAEYSLYYQYLQKMIVKYSGSISVNCDVDDNSLRDEKYKFKNTSTQWCAINVAPDKSDVILDEEVTILGDGDSYRADLIREKGGTKTNFRMVLEWLSNENSYVGLADGEYAEGEVSEDGILTPSDDGGGEDGGGETVEPTCANSGGADKLGWIICPVMEWAIDASKKMYDQYIEPALQVDPILFTGGESSDNTAKSAWNIFRNIANILFAILFLVVIFSQLTGVGIDNYGIKKILPKLILTALLVNLSYYICMVCVDLSNIFGNGLQSILDGMAKGMTISIDGKTPGDAGVGATAISAVAILATLGVVGVAVWKNAAILLPLVISAIGVVIAILFLFVLLSARQAAILMLTVVSPIAFACYMLPNTKKLFDKWLKIGKGLLLVYPICGIMVGGGNFASKLLMATSAAGGSESNGFFQAFTAMLIGIAPIFFIPSTLKGAFAALGNIGAKLSGFGDKVRSGATRGMRNSNLNKRLQERGLENKTRFNAGYKRNGEKKDLNGFQRFIRGGRKNVQRSAIAYQKNVSDKGSLNATEGKDFMLQTQTANVMKELNASGEINSIKDLGTGLEKALVSGDRARIRAYTDALSAKGENGRKAVGEAYDSAVRQGMASNARKTFADNIMTNHAADYKNNSRGIYELAKGINTGSRDIDNNTTVAGYVGSHRAGLARSVTSTTIGNMDDDACGGIFGGYDGKEVSLPSEFLGDTDEAKNDRHALGATIYAALNDQNANIKSGRRSVLEKALELTGYQAEPKTVRIDGGAGAQAGGGAPAVPAARTGIAQEGQSFDVHGGNGGGADPAWNNYNVTPEMRDEFISQGLAPGDAEIDQYRRR